MPLQTEVKQEPWEVGSGRRGLALSRKGLSRHALPTSTPGLYAESEVGPLFNQFGSRRFGNSTGRAPGKFCLVQP